MEALISVREGSSCVSYGCFGGADDVSIVTKTVEGQVTFDFTYPMMNGVMRVVKEMQARIIDRRFDTDCSITLAVPVSRTEELRRRLNELSFS